jgi:hypothetical protein
MAGWAVSLALRGAGLAAGPAGAPAPTRSPGPGPAAGAAGPPADGLLPEGPAFQAGDLTRTEPMPSPDQRPVPSTQAGPSVMTPPGQDVLTPGAGGRAAGTDLAGPDGSRTDGGAGGAGPRQQSEAGRSERRGDLPEPGRGPLPSPVVAASQVRTGPARPTAEATSQPAATERPGAAWPATRSPAVRSAARDTDPPARRGAPSARTPHAGDDGVPRSTPFPAPEASPPRIQEDPTDGEARPVRSRPTAMPSVFQTGQPSTATPGHPTPATVRPEAPPAGTPALAPLATPQPPRHAAPADPVPRTAPAPSSTHDAHRGRTAARTGRRREAAGPSAIEAPSPVAEGRKPAPAATPHPTPVPVAPVRSDGDAPVPVRPSPSSSASPTSPRLPAVPTTADRAAPSAPEPPSVQVRIGTVEVRATPPPAAATPPAQGFGEYRSMRAYLGWRLDGGHDA